MTKKIKMEYDQKIQSGRRPKKNQNGKQKKSKWKTKKNLNMEDDQEKIK